uniref:Uncharacterized protein n=1 Tax=Anguilla anguilla TaxID=7936 RepID=A0A0E9TWS3_ANGAN
MLFFHFSFCCSCLVFTPLLFTTPLGF